MSDSEEETPKISLKIKTTQRTYDITVKNNATIGEVKDTVLPNLENAAKEQLCLIFSGKILKDHETVQALNISDGMAIHLVVRQSAPASSSTPSANRASATSTPQPSTPQQQASGGPAPNLFAPSARGAAAGAQAGGPMGMAAQMMNNPDMLRQMMDNPILQNILGNPDILRSMFTNNPQFQGLMERNPELGHILNDPDMMRQTMEMMRNPNMFQEMMRSHDLAMRNLQGMPGGEAALQRLYTEVQEPLLNSAASAMGGNPFESLRQPDDNATSRSQRAGVENSEALPNPWGGSGAQAAPNAAGGTTGAPGFANMFGAGGLESLMQQMMGDPATMQAMMGPEMINMLNQQVASNPQLIQQLMDANPMVAGNPQLAQQLRSQLPAMMNMLNRPEALQAMSNPRVIEALRQIQQGTETLRREAPFLLEMGGMAPLAAGAGAAGAVPGARLEAGAAAAQPGQPDIALMNRLMASMGLGGGQSLSNPGGMQAPPNPEETYAAQLEQLANMGFTNRAQNIAALRASFGDLNGAVERLLNSQP